MPQPPMKHIVESNALLEASNVSRDIVILQGAINPDPFTNLNQVKAGSIVQAIECDLTFAPDDAVAVGNPIDLRFFIWYNINGAQTPPTPLLVGQSHLKNQVFLQELDMFSAQVGTRVAKYRIKLRIPRNYQQINDGDQIILRYKYTSGVALNCDTNWQFIYKEYFP